jgi:hypothetical protein
MLELKLHLSTYNLQCITSELLLSIVIMFFDIQILEIYIVKFTMINVLIKGLCPTKIKPRILTYKNLSPNQIIWKISLLRIFKIIHKQFNVKNCFTETYRILFRAVQCGVLWSTSITWPNRWAWFHVFFIINRSTELCYLNVAPGCKLRLCLTCGNFSFLLISRLCYWR